MDDGRAPVRDGAGFLRKAVGFPGVLLDRSMLTAISSTEAAIDEAASLWALARWATASEAWSRVSAAWDTCSALLTMEPMVVRRVFCLLPMLAGEALVVLALAIDLGWSGRRAIGMRLVISQAYWIAAQAADDVCGRGAPGPRR